MKFLVFLFSLLLMCFLRWIWILHLNFITVSHHPYSASFHHSCFIKRNQAETEHNFHFYSHISRDSFSHFSIFCSISLDKLALSIFKTIYQFREQLSRISSNNICNAKRSNLFYSLLMFESPLLKHSYLLMKQSCLSMKAGKLLFAYVFYQNLLLCLSSSGIIKI